MFGGFDRHRHTRQAQPQVSMWNEIKVAMVLCCGRDVYPDMYHSLYTLPTTEWNRVATNVVRVALVR